tara:strand:- start:1987 stop:2202 length:216 start_codon:yes stop_codon:yes gene_type:complete
METFMSNLYIILADHHGARYRCDSVDEAVAVSDYLVRKFGGLAYVESTSSTMLDDFEKLTSYFLTKEVNNG